MKLVYLADIRFPMERANGIQTIETCHALARAGVEVELVVRRSDARSDASCLDFYGLAPHPNLTLRRVRVLAPGSPAGRLTFAARSLPALARSGSDAVYTRDLALADLAIRLRFCHGLPVVYEAHTAAALFSQEAPNLYRDAVPAGRRKIQRLMRRERRVCRQVSALVTITRQLLDCLERFYGPLAATRVIPDGTRLPREIHPPRVRTKGEPVRVYYVGQLYPWKGVDTLLESMREVPAAELTVVGGIPGEPDLERTRDLARDLGIAERVRFRGFLPPPRVAEERLQADLFVIPLRDSITARHFTSPLKLFEAMASGRPVVASDLPSVREVLADEVNALLVPPGNPRAMAAAIRRLAEDAKLGARLAGRAGEDVKQYSWDERARKITDLLTGLRQAPAPGSTP